MSKTDIKGLVVFFVKVGAAMWAWRQLAARSDLAKNVTG